MRKGGNKMRKALLTVALALPLGAFAATPAFADVSTTQHLPAQACNQGTMNTHENIPETTGTGATTPGHGDVHGTANVSPCGHGG
jgi:hypothetical protein